MTAVRRKEAERPRCGAPRAHAGFDFLVGEKDGKAATLLLDMNQQKYVFTREGSAK